MKIFVEGSQRSAVRRMFDIWANLGHIVLFTEKGADVRLSTVKFRTKSSLPTVLRLDGVYYDLAVDYNKRNRFISKSHANAHGVVYQSNISKAMCEYYLSERRTDKFSIIYNGIADIWNKPKKHKGINVISCSKWRRPKRLEETIQVFDSFHKEYPESRLHIIGPMIKGQQIIERPGIVKYWGKVDHDKMKEIYSYGDLYLHLCKKDSCPSTVVEAIASGMPVITTNACGGATEMCKMTYGCIIVNGERLSYDPVYIYTDEYNKLSKKVKEEIVVAMVSVITDKMRVVLPNELNIKTTAKKYLKIMNQVLK